MYDVAHSPPPGPAAFMPRSSGTSSNPQTVPHRISAPAATSGSLASNCDLLHLFITAAKNHHQRRQHQLRVRQSYRTRSKTRLRRATAKQSITSAREIKIKNKPHADAHSPASSRLCPSPSPSSSSSCCLHLPSASFLHPSPLEPLPRVGFLPAQGLSLPLQRGQTISPSPA